MKKLIQMIKKNCTFARVSTAQLLEDQSGDQMTSFLIVLLVVVVAGAAFMSLYSDGITSIWTALVSKITGLIS